MDTGWSWVVCGAAFVTHTLTIGFSYGIGVYYVEFLTVFKESKGTTAWISSLNYGFLCGLGELVCVTIRYFHCYPALLPQTSFKTCTLGLWSLTIIVFGIRSKNISQHSICLVVILYLNFINF